MINQKEKHIAELKEKIYTVNKIYKKTYRDGELDYLLELDYEQGKDATIVWMSIFAMTDKQKQIYKNIIDVAWHRTLKSNPLFFVDNWQLFTPEQAE